MSVQKLPSKRDHVLAMLAETPGGLDAGAIMVELGISQAHTSAILRKLAAEGRVRRHGGWSKGIRWTWAGLGETGFARRSAYDLGLVTKRMGALGREREKLMLRLLEIEASLEALKELLESGR